MGHRLYLVLFVLLVAISQVSSRPGRGCRRRGKHRHLRNHHEIDRDYKALPGQTPYLIRLSKEKHGNDFFCTGAILTSRSFVTAGSCFKSLSANEKVYFVLGDWSLKDEGDERVFEVEHYMVHENMTSYSDNIALFTTRNSTSIRLPEDGYGAYYRIPIAENNPASNVNLGRLYTTAWSHENANHGTPRFYPTNITSFSKCDPQNPHIDKSFCSHVAGIGEGPCSTRDLGAPLVRISPEVRETLAGHVELLGIMTEVPNCAKLNVKPTTFIDLRQYKDWLDFAWRELLFKHTFGKSLELLDNTSLWKDSIDSD